MNKILNWLPVISLAGVFLIAWGAMGAKVDAIADEQNTLKEVTARSVANEAKVDANVRLIGQLGQRVSDAQTDVRRTQDKLDKQQEEIILLLRQRGEDRN